MTNLNEMQSTILLYFIRKFFQNEQQIKSNGKCDFTLLYTEILSTNKQQIESIRNKIEFQKFQTTSIDKKNIFNCLRSIFSCILRWLMLRSAPNETLLFRRRIARFASHLSHDMDQKMRVPIYFHSRIASA